MENLIGHGIKGKNVLSRWNKKHWEKLACLLIEDVNQTQNLKYLLDNYLQELLVGIETTLKKNELKECVVYISEAYFDYAEKLKSLSIKVVIVKEAKRGVNDVFDGNTLVHHAETFVQIAKSLNRENYSQKKIMTIEGDINTAGIVEIPFSITLNEVINEYAGGMSSGKELKFIQVGGKTGSIFTARELDTKFNYLELIKNGTMLEASKIEIFNEDTCVVDWAVKNTRSNSKDTCGKCVLCREGFYQIYKIMKDAAEGKSKDGDLAFAKEISEKITEGTLCDYGKTAANPIKTLIEEFSDEIEKHMERKICQTLTCNSYSNFYVDPATCIGCGECISSCEENAIRGGDKLIHIIDMDSCVKCGKCEEVCKNKSVKRYGNIKPIIPNETIAVGSFNADSASKKGLGVAKKRRRRS